MEQIFMIEVFVKKIKLKIIPPEKDEYELRLEAEEKKREAEALAAAEAAKKGKKGAKPPKPKKGKKGKAPPMPSEEEVRFMESCTLQMICQGIFDFYVAYDNFIAPPPAPPPGKGKKKPPKPKKKKGKGAVVKLVLPSEPLPQAPYFGVGNSLIFLSRPSILEEVIRKTPIYIFVWNRDQQMNCVGYCMVAWHKSFFDCLQKASDMNPCDMDQGKYRNTTKSEISSNTVQFTQPIICEEDLKPSGEIEFLIRLTCLGNKVISCFIALPEMERLPGRKYVTDDLKLLDVEIVRHWEGTTIEAAPPIAYLFSAPEILKDPIKPVEIPRIYEHFVAPYTASEYRLLEMGYPKGICPGLVCCKKVRNAQPQSLHETVTKKSSSKIDIRGTCGKLKCLSKNVSPYICNEGAEQTCRKPCSLSKLLLPEV